jgi:hypothetical protein
MILPSDMFDFYPSKDTSELAGFLDVPPFGESIEESCTEGISTSGRIGRGMDENGRNFYFTFL